MIDSLADALEEDCMKHVRNSDLLPCESLEKLARQLRQISRTKTNYWTNNPSIPNVPYRKNVLIPYVMASTVGFTTNFDPNKSMVSHRKIEFCI
jgi:hypothetical protein